jgi:osmotically-inducible protein OsmY
MSRNSKSQMPSSTYDRSVERLNDADRYENSGESEYSRERSNPYEMVDYMLDHGFDFRGMGPKDYRRSDERIWEDVCEVLLRDPRIDASEVDVSVEDGIVLLRGKVESRRIKRLAELAVESILGVLDVQNLLTFRAAL